MGYKYIATIPFDQIDHVELYVNKSKKSLGTIKKEKGCKYIMNGGLFNMKTHEQLCNVKANGIVYSYPEYSEYGMSWNTNDVRMKIIPNADRNFIGMKALCINGVNQSVNDKHPDLGGKRGRTAMAIKGNNLVLFCCKDGTSYALKPSALQAELKTLGCTDSLMLDGGGSSQCDFGGNTITSSRKVANLILVYTKKTASTAPATTTLIAPPVSMTPTTGTTNTAVNIRSGPGTSYAKLGTLKKGAKITVTGKTVSGNWYRYEGGWVSATYVYLDSNKPITSKCPYAYPATATLKYGSSGNNVKWLQWYLVHKFNYTLAIDGSFGPATKTAVLDFQRKHDLADDGIVGPNTKNAILN